MDAMTATPIDLPPAWVFAGIGTANCSLPRTRPVDFTVALRYFDAASADASRFRAELTDVREKMRVALEAENAAVGIPAAEEYLGMLRCLGRADAGEWDGQLDDDYAVAGRLGAALSACFWWTTLFTTAHAGKPMPVRSIAHETLLVMVAVGLMHRKAAHDNATLPGGDPDETLRHLCAAAGVFDAIFADAAAGFALATSDPVAELTPEFHALMKVPADALPVSLTVARRTCR